MLNLTILSHCYIIIIIDNACLNTTCYYSSKMGNCQKEQSDEGYIGNEKGPIQIMRITNYIWNKDYQGLFDYDSKTIQKKSIKVKGNSIVSKDAGLQFELLPDDIQSLSQKQLKQSLFRIGQKDNYFQITPVLVESQKYTIQKLLWLVVSSLPDKNHVIEERDIIKLGKQKIRIREIVHEDANPSMGPENIKLSKTIYSDLRNKTAVDKKEQGPEKQAAQENDQQITISDQICKVCLDPGEHQNPLITPCKCSGSVRYIHLKCLKSWLAKRLNAVKNHHCITINWQPLSCEMCKASFKYRIYMDGKKFYTVDIPKPPKPYIIAQLMSKNSKSSYGKIFHFISFSQKLKVALGRRKDIDVKVSEDISISRAHAFIEYNPEQKQFRLSDNKSKFGTLVLIKKGITVRPKLAGISFQVGAQVFSFQAFRGPGSEIFEPEKGKDTDYMLEYLSDEEDQDIEEENDNESQYSNPAEGQPQSPALLLHHVTSISQPE